MNIRACLHFARLYWPLTLILAGWVVGLTACGAGFGLAVGLTLWGCE